MGATRTHKERKGSEATRFMTVLFVLGQHTVLEAFPARTRAGENEMAILDGMCTVCRPERLEEMHSARWRGTRCD